MPILYGHSPEGSDRSRRCTPGGGAVRREGPAARTSIRSWRWRTGCCRSLFWQRPVQIQPARDDAGAAGQLFERQARLVDEPQPGVRVRRPRSRRPGDRTAPAERRGEQRVAGARDGGRGEVDAAGASGLVVAGAPAWSARFSLQLRGPGLDGQPDRPGDRRAAARSRSRKAELELSDDAQLEQIAPCCAATRHLLVLDNAESITAAPASIPHALPEAEQDASPRFLSRLRGGPLVVFGSRGPELAGAGHVRANVYELARPGPPGRLHAGRTDPRPPRRHSPDRPERTRRAPGAAGVLGGYPLPLTVVLPALAARAPSTCSPSLRAAAKAPTRSG